MTGGAAGADSPPLPDAGTAVPDAATDVAPPMCLPPGATCTQQGSCCGGFNAPCVENVCEAECTQNSDCANGCCLLTVTPHFCAPLRVCTGIGPDPECGRFALHGSDRTFLGVAASDKYATDGLCNQYSSYGSAYSSTSVFDKYSIYGSKYSQWSAYDEHTSTPPFLLCEKSGQQQQWVTKNTTLAPRIDPDVLCTWLGANGH
jgi:hypothetical protein